MKLAVLQIKAFDVDHGPEALAHALSRIDEAARHRPDLMVLPECTYPGYVLGSRQAPGTSADELREALGRFCEAARRHSCHIAVGLPEREGEKLFNSGFLIGPGGAVAGKARKSLLWHFDAQWFDAGDEVTVVDTALGRLGLLICADARLPEIPRLMRLKGARVILDMTNWVSTGSDPARLTNPQYEFMAPARAVENAVWFAAANKVGIERGCVLYCGRSCVLDPLGRRVAAAGSCEEETLVCTVDAAQPADDEVTPGLKVISGRRPETYQGITQGPRPEPALDAPRPLFLACLQAPPSPPLHGLGETVRMLRTDMVICPDERIWGADTSALQAFAAESGAYVIAGGSGDPDGRRPRTVRLFAPDGRSELYRKVHGVAAGSDRVDRPYPVFETIYGRIGFLLDEEGFLFEPARILALEGADLIVWITGEPRRHLVMMAQTRAAENGVFVAVSGPPQDGSDPGSLVVGPQGTVLSAGLPGVTQIITAQLVPGMARLKQIVPGTDALAARALREHDMLTDAASRARGL